MPDPAPRTRADVPIQMLPPRVRRSMPMNPKPNIEALSNVPSRSNEPDFGLSGSDFLPSR